MSNVFTFPGQGSQFVVMGKDVAEAYPEAMEVFQRVDETLGEKLSDIIWNGPEDVLKQTSNTQPALMAVSLAVMKGLECEGFKLKGCVDFVAGHSLGEYSALAAAGALSIEQTARLLRIRGEAMQSAVPVGKGAMAAIIGLDLAALTSVVEEASKIGICEFANDNGGGQIVISGSKAGVEAACELAKEKGAKRALLLPVSAPFHCSLMQPAAEVMQEALAETAIVEPQVPVLPNVLVEPVNDPEKIRSSLVEQVTGQVRWRETVEWFANNEVTTLYEIGAGKVLTGLARRINRDLSVVAVNTVDDIKAAAQTLNAQ